MRWCKRLSVALLVTLLVACGPAVPFSQHSRTPHYQVQLSLDRASLGPREIIVEVHDHANQPVTLEQVQLLPAMHQMGMASAPIPVAVVGPGRYRTTQEVFTMTGAWEVAVQIDGNGVAETASFVVEATP